MAALVQTFPQETGTITMLQTRPNSSTGRMPSGQQTTLPQYASAAQAPRTTFNGNATLTGYRGSSTPVTQYAFQSTPSLNQWQPQTSYRLSDGDSNTQQRHRFPSTGQTITTSRDDSALYQNRPSTRPQTQTVGSPKSTPDRYRRGNAQAGQHARSQSASLPLTGTLPATTQFYNTGNTPRTAVDNRPTSFYATVPSSVDSLQLRPQPDQAATSPDEKRVQAARSASYNSAHSRTGSSGSAQSSRSAHSRSSSATRGAAADEAADKTEQAKPLAVPARGSSDASKRMLSPSPLSRSGTMADDDDAEPSAAPAKPESPAVKQLSAIQKGAKPKSKTSRLRRAFSFGSAAELRKAAGGQDLPDRPDDLTLREDHKADDTFDAEQARIAAAQEAAGLGSSIYGGRFNLGSTDNLSISSTASSASIMIRKMGRGVKKGSRSLAGLFRPKSVVGVPPADPMAPEGSEATVSMVTVEAETQRVNVAPTAQSGDPFPHVERNSLDANRVPDMSHERTNSSETDSSRRSIVGGDRERAEVLAAVRKGILKRTGSSSPSVRPVDGGMLPTVPAITDSPNSSAPSTPNDDVQGHRRTGSVAIGSEDYFMSALRLRQDSKSTPTTPQGTVKRNATFSPRLVFHDTWPSQEYDRRSEVATCNRLTPMLAQQIKEEINTFKMVRTLRWIHPLAPTYVLTRYTGDGGARELQDLHPILLDGAVYSRFPRQEDEQREQQVPEADNEAAAATREAIQQWHQRSKLPSLTFSSFPFLAPFPSGVLGQTA